AVSTCGLRRVEAVQEAVRERIARRPLERLGQRVDGCAGDEDVPLRRVARPGAPTGPVDAFAPGVGRRAALRVDDPELAVLAALVRGGEPFDRLLCGQALPQQRESV